MAQETLNLKVEGSSPSSRTNIMENVMTDDEADMYYDRWLAVKNKVKMLESGPGGIMEMKQTIADKEAEIERLRAALQKITDDNGYTECCGGGTIGDQFNPPECCGDPVCAFDRCVKIARTALAGEKADA